MSGWRNAYPSQAGGATGVGAPGGAPSGRPRANALAGFRMDVPLVAQEKANTCWYAAACMVSYYFRAGPRLGVPHIWAEGDRRGIRGDELVQLTRNEGLTDLPLLRYHAGAALMYPGNVLEGMLRKAGPLWCAGEWFGAGHAIVLTGIAGQTLFFNDPDGGVAKTGTVPWFNEKVYRDLPGHLLCKDPARS